MWEVVQSDGIWIRWRKGEVHLFVEVITKRELLQGVRQGEAMTKIVCH